LYNANQGGAGKKTQGGIEEQPARDSSQRGAPGQGRAPFGLQRNAGTPAAEQGNQGHGKNRGAGKKIDFPKPLPGEGVQYGLDDNAPADSADRADGRSKAGNEQKSQNLQSGASCYGKIFLLYRKVLILLFVSPGLSTKKPNRRIILIYTPPYGNCPYGP
jgi:hypothetical protein